MKQTAVEWLEKIHQGQKGQPFDDYEDKYKVSAIEQFNYINVRIQMPYEYDKVHQFKEYMTAKELAEII